MGVERSWHNVDLANLTEREKRFCHEYCIDLNAKQAAIRAGYSPKAASVQGTKLMKKPTIKRAIGFMLRKVDKKSELTAQDVTEQLKYVVTRSGADFIDRETGKLKPLNKLPKRALQSIDGIEQKVTTLRGPDGEEIGETVETKIKLVPKASAIDMALKHFGMYAAEEKRVQVLMIEWDKLYESARDKPDPVEERLRTLEHNGG